MDRKTHYRVLRSTIVLAKNSKAYASIQNPALRQAVAQATAKNYQFDQIKPEVLELLYVHFDEQFTDRVRSEFVFYPAPRSVRVHPSATAICDLCGKGDSKETGDNRDHLKIEFLLTNTAGGTDVWCGSTCIVNFGLKVDGAATAEEAARLLSMSMRQAVRQFQIDAWRAEHPEHREIPDHYQTLRREVSRAHSLIANYFGELVLAGIDPTRLSAGAMRDAAKALRVASRFYQRSGYLTSAKEADWMFARRVLEDIEEISRVVRGAHDIQDPDARFDYFKNLCQEKRSGQAA